MRKNCILFTIIMVVSAFVSVFVTRTVCSITDDREYEEIRADVQYASSGNTSGPSVATCVSGHISDRGAEIHGDGRVPDIGTAMCNDRHVSDIGETYGVGQVSDIGTVARVGGQNDIASIPADQLTGATVFSDKKQEQEEEERRAEQYRAVAERLMKELQEKTEEIAELTEKLEKTNKEVVELRNKVREAEKDVHDMEEKIAEMRETMSDIIRMMYEEGYEDPLLFITSEDEYDVINRNEYVKAINKYLNDTIFDMNKLLADDIKRSEELKTLKEKEEKILVGYYNEQNNLQIRMNELVNMIEEAKREADNAEDLAKALEIQVKEEEARRRELSRKTSGKVRDAIIRDTSGTDFFYVEAYPYTQAELTLLAAIIQAEAGGVDYAGMIAVGSVVMNRVDDPRFPDTIPGVIYAPYQFEPADSGSLALILANGPVSSCYMAAEDVLNGTRNVTNLYFKAKWYAEEHGISGVNIGGNVFH